MANEKRLIDAKPLMQSGWHLVRTGESNKFLASMSLADVHTVDAVEVVRCKDCEHWHEETAFCEEHSRFDSFGMDWNMFEENDFCSYGERKNESESL